MNDKGNGTGCLIWILVLSAIFGNFMLLSGDLAYGGDLEGNPFAILMVIVAVIADIALVVWLISWAVRTAEKKQQEKEQQRINEVAQKVNDYIRRFTPGKSISLRKAREFAVSGALINKEIVFTVNQFKESLRNKIIKCNELDQAIMQLLSCPGCQNVDEKFAHLSAKAVELQRLKGESDVLHSEIKRHKIRILHEDGNLLFAVKKAFSSVCSSKKCVGEGFNLKEFICDEKPADLMFFDYKYAPAILRIGPFYYCLFSTVILVFDATGVFVSAIDPTALLIKTKRVCVDVWVYNDKLPSHQYIDEDSKCIEKGNSRLTWLHTCRDGSPDLRYSYNPASTTRTDKYEYGEITISVLDNSVVFCLSSDVATNALERVNGEYVKKHNNKHNPIPEFLNLLDRTTDDGDPNLAYIITAAQNGAAKTNYFCTII